MGKIVYEPKKIRDEVKEQNVAEVMTEQEINEKETRYNQLIDSIDSVRPIGETDCEYIMYLEDYVYTYMYQFAATDLSVEHAAMIIGEYYPDTKENIICGILPVPRNKLNPGDEWINREAVESLIADKDKYFPGTVILGWLHMQPGYGTMLTMKEVKTHRELFDREGSVLLLVDPINKIETFYVYEDDTLKEQTGYYLYYDKNPAMQKYMLEHPFIETEKEQQEDTVVNQFREIGRMRKKEYQQRKKTNFTVVAACMGLLVVGAIAARQSDQKNAIKQPQEQVQVNDANKQVASGSEEVNFIIEPKDKVANTEVPVENPTEVVVSTEDLKEVTTEAVTDNTEVAEETAETKEVISEEVVIAEEPAKEEVKEEVKEDVQEEVKETVKEEKVEASEEEYITYTVQDGDTLRKISFDHYKTELRAKEIIKLNGIDNGDNIYPGQKLKLPLE